MTPLEKDLKEYYTPGKPNRDKEVAQMKEVSESKGKDSRRMKSRREIPSLTPKISPLPLLHCEPLPPPNNYNNKKFEEGWYFEDELKETHGPIFKQDLVEVVKAAGEWETRVWNVNVLVEDEHGKRLTFRQVFPDQVGQTSSIYKEEVKEEVKKAEEKVHESPVVRNSGEAAAEDPPETTPSVAAEEVEELEESEKEEAGSSPVSLDSMISAIQRMQKTSNPAPEAATSSAKTPVPPTSSAATPAAEKPKPPAKADMLSNLLQDAEAMLSRATPGKPEASGSVEPDRQNQNQKEASSSSVDGATQQQKEDEKDGEGAYVVELEPLYTKEDLEGCEMTMGFLSKYVSVQRQSLLFRKNLFRAE